VAGSEFSGVVLKAPTSLPGGRTPRYKEGDKVFGASQGGYATHVCCDESRLKPMPDGWSFMDAAGVFVTGPTSYAGLVNRAGIKKGKLLYCRLTAG
jgi:NADPH:quinone reductase